MNDAPHRGAEQMPHGSARAAGPSRGARIALAAAAAFFFCAFAFLGSWQVKRLQWKQDLIARVEARVHADPVPAPRAAEWPRVAVDTHEYLRVTIRGTFLYDYTTRVQTTTALGIGFWLMTPMCTEDGIVFVNRGFVPMKSGDLNLPPPPVASGDVCAQVRSPQRQVPGSDPPGLTPGVASGVNPEIEITGLLRFPEPKGRILRENDPAGDRWYTRDIGPIAAKRGMPRAAPFFVDAPAGQEHPRDGDEKPTGGLTVIAFPNNHLVYALTWFGLAAMVVGGYYLVLRYDRRRTKGTDDGTD
ncbi:SURF1 family protein [Pseudoduganella lutea]|uniref:SURF1-like protein n=1 Tax=Pseudoduganella lutea TaxID=321985 RepID=A0A4P6L4D2_9BURK|nr:SURF1 family protein [Pseudoduganella lutea]QBE66165.1 SURF1 family protein [Pseudoduganella lutea]